jgi:hypothetical protein
MGTRRSASLPPGGALTALPETSGGYPRQAGGRPRAPGFHHGASSGCPEAIILHPEGPSGCHGAIGGCHGRPGVHPEAPSGYHSDLFCNDLRRIEGRASLPASRPTGGRAELPLGPFLRTRYTQTAFTTDGPGCTRIKPTLGRASRPASRPEAGRAELLLGPDMGTRRSASLPLGRASLPASRWVVDRWACLCGSTSACAAADRRRQAATPLPPPIGWRATHLRVFRTSPFGSPFDPQLSTINPQPLHA